MTPALNILLFMNIKLKEILDWILHNKEWIFGGIGVFILSTISFLIINLIIRNRDKKEEQIKGIAKRYVDVLDLKTNGHPGIIGLIESGAAHLTKNKYLIRVCEIITHHGKPFPLKKWELDNIGKKELLKFIKWQANNKINFSDYFNEREFTKLIQRYKEEDP